MSVFQLLSSAHETQKVGLKVTHVGAVLDIRHDLLPEVAQIVYLVVVLAVALVVANALLAMPAEGEVPPLADESRVKAILDGGDLAPRVPAGRDDHRRPVEDLGPHSEREA